MAALDNVNKTQFHMSANYGDAVPGGYSGDVRAFHGDKTVGHLNYLTADGEPGFSIGMVEVHKDYQHKGIATNLLKSAMSEAPGPVDPGYRTEAGDAWWKKSGKKTAKTFKGEWNPNGYDF